MSASSDLSSRYVLPAGAAYLENLAALWSVDPALARRVEEAEDLPDDGRALVVERAKSGAPTLVVRAGDGRAVTLHSRYDPATEGRRLAGAPGGDGGVAFYVLGFGLGYHVEALFERAGPEGLVCAFEADVRVLRACFEHRDLSEMIASGRLLFFVTPDKSEVFNRLVPQAAMCSMGFEGLAHGPSLALAPEFYARVQETIAEYAAYARTCLSTLVLNGRRTAENVARNVGVYAGADTVSDLAGLYRGLPAIVVSAGPSLRKNRHLLRDAAGRAVIVAVQTVLQPLLEMGIEPQFVTSLDYHDISTRYYEKLPPALRTRLVAEPKASPAIFDVFPGPVSVLGNDFADSLLRELTGRGPAARGGGGGSDGAGGATERLEKGRLRSGSTVAHLAYYLAEHLGCDPIIFVGQDLGFSDALAYVPGTNIDDVWRPELGRFCTVEMRQWEFIARDRHILRRVPDQQGRPMYTEERLYTYLQQFERDFLQAGARIIDATEGGARKRGATPMKLADAIREFCKAPLPEAERPKSDGPFRPGLRWLRAGRCAASLQARREEARQIELVARETLPLLEEIRDHLEDQARVNRAIARVDALRARMDQFGPTYDLVLQLTQGTELKRFQKDRTIAASKVSGVDRQRRQIERDLENVRAVAGAAADFQRLMDDAIGRLLKFSDPVAAGGAAGDEPKAAAGSGGPRQEAA